MLGEGVGGEAGVAVSLGTGRKMRPVERLGFGCGEPEHEVGGEALGVALDLFVQAPGGHAVERGEVRIEHDPLAAQEKDAAYDAGGGDERGRLVLLVDRELSLSR